MPSIILGVQNRVKDWSENRRWVCPADYSPENALTAARLIIEEMVETGERNPHRGKRTADVVSTESIIAALFSMIVQGLDPTKKQCYFIRRGTALTLFRSYFGDIVMAERVRPGQRIYFEAIYDGDKVKMDKRVGRTYVVSHEQELENQNNKPVGAYAGSRVEETGEDLGCLVMTAERIRISWENNPDFTEKKTHTNFTAEMYMRTAVRKWCKPIINSSSDKALLEIIRASEDEAFEAQLAQEAEKANAEALSLPPKSDVSTIAPGSTGEAVIYVKDESEKVPVETTKPEPDEPKEAVQEGPGF